MANEDLPPKAQIPAGPPQYLPMPKDAQWHIPARVLRNFTGQEELDALRKWEDVPLHRKIGVIWLDEADAADPLNQLRVVGLRAGDFVAYATLADTCDKHLVVQALVNLALTYSDEIKAALGR